MENGQPVAVPWHETEESFLETIAMLPAVDRDLAGSYASFVANTEGFEKKIVSFGGVPYRIPVEAAALKSWCHSQGRTICKESIRIYAAIQLGFRVRKSRDN